MYKNKTHIFQAIAVVGLTLVTSVFSGCGKVTPRYTPQDITNHMEELYGEKFEYVDLFGYNNTSKKLKIRMTCESFPGQEVIGEAVAFGSSTAYRDNYLNVKFADRIHETIEDAAQQVYADCRVWTRIDDTTLESYDPDISFEEYTSQDLNDALYFSLFVAPGYDMSKKDEDLEKLASIFKEKKFVSSFKIYFVKDDEVYAESIEELISRTINSKWLDGFGVFANNTDFELDRIRWDF